MRRFGMFALSAAGLTGLIGEGAYGERVRYQASPGATNGFTQQNGNAEAYIGDDVHLDRPHLIDDVNITFGFFTYAAATYTPDIRVDLFDVDTSGLPIDSNPLDTLSYTPIATAHRTDVTFTGSNYNNGGSTSSTRQTVQVSFTSQLIVRKDFAFAFRDDNPSGTTSPGFGFSIYTTGAAPSIGSSNVGILTASPTGLGSTTFSSGGSAAGGDYAIEASVTSPLVLVPEPASLGLLSVGGLTLMRRRRR